MEVTPQLQLGSRTFSSVLSGTEPAAWRRPTAQVRIQDSGHLNSLSLCFSRNY